MRFAAICVVAVSSTVLAGAWLLFRKNSERAVAALIGAGWFWFLIFLFVPVYTASTSLLGSVGLRSGAIFGYLAVVILTCIAAVRLSKFEPFRFAALVFATVLAGMPASQIILAAQTGASPSADIEAPAAPAVQSVKRESTGRNIYYVVVDGYGSPRALKEFLDVDVSDFIGTMRTSGFYSAENALAAYNVTFMALAAIVSGEYLSETSRSSLYPKMMHSALPPAVGKLKNAGYRYYVVGNQWAECQGPHVDCIEFEAPPRIPYEMRTLLAATPFNWLEDTYGLQLFSRSPEFGVDALGRARSLFQADRLPDGPYFMLIHHLSPHPPYMFHEDCEVRKKYTFSFSSWHKDSKSLYVDNLKCTNRKILQFSQTLARYDPDAIIVVVGDHGSAFNTNWALPVEQWTEAQIRERSSVITLARFPAPCQKWLSPHINSINLVRLATACASDVEPDLLPNKAYITRYFKDTEPAHAHLVAERP